MKRFAQLYRELDETNRTTEKVAALVRYFREVEPRDAAWAVYYLTGRRTKRAVTHTQLRGWVAEASGYPAWLVNESYDAVGDLSETLALLLEASAFTRSSETSEHLPLHRLIEDNLLILPRLTDLKKQEKLRDLWSRLSGWECFVFHKLISGAFRVGVSKTLVTRALAEVAAVDQAVMTHRLLGKWQPTACHFQKLLSDQLPDDPARPYPFYLASPIAEAPGWPDLDAALGAVRDWQVEWKWDGIRAQLIHRAGQTMLWSRGEERIDGAFPEIMLAGSVLPMGTVLDGEIVAWSISEDRPRPFQALQKRLGRKAVEPTLFGAEVEVRFIAYDLLEQAGEEVRDLPMRARREELEAVVTGMDQDGRAMIQLSPLIEQESWGALRELQEQARAMRAEGLMLKSRESVYGVGRRKGSWWKWKVDPYTIDAVMIYAERGHGQRASLYSDYTFGLWDGESLVPIAKAYSGLTDAELRRVDRWIQQHTVGRHGPVRVVEPELVFEIAFEGVQTSDRHQSGLALRFPRIHRWREDKKPQEADTLAGLRRLVSSEA